MTLWKAKTGGNLSTLGLRAFLQDVLQGLSIFSSTRVGPRR
jgi:hypothetical protein